MIYLFINCVAMLTLISLSTILTHENTFFNILFAILLLQHKIYGKLKLLYFLYGATLRQLINSDTPILYRYKQYYNAL